MNKEDFQKDILPTLILTIIVCVAVVALTVVNSFTEEVIIENERKVLLENLQNLFPEMDDFTYNENIDGFILLKENDTVGYAFNVTAKGYAGDIELVLGLDNTTFAEDDIVIRGIGVISQGETPALGAEITKDYFQDEFKSITANDVVIDKDGGEIDSLSGATITSRAVTNSINSAAKAKAALIREHILEVV